MQVKTISLSATQQLAFSSALWRIRAALVMVFSLLLGAAGSAWAQTSSTSATGVWSYSSGGYLTLLEDVSSGTVVALQINSTYDSGKVYVGKRSGSVISGQTPDKSGSLEITLSGSTYTGSVTASGSSTTVSGQLLFTYQGSANDGVWQRNGSTTRYLVNLTLMVGSAPLMVMMDANINTTTPSVTYDISTGTVASGSTPTYVGKSLTTGYTVTLAFKGGSPATGFYSVLDNSRPPKTVEQFDVTQILKTTP